MAKYIIDLDSFKECLSFLAQGAINCNRYAYLQDIETFIERFPKCKVEETVNIEMTSNIKVGDEQ